MTIYNHQQKAEETDTEKKNDVFKLPLKVMSFIFNFNHKKQHQKK